MPDELGIGDALNIRINIKWLIQLVVLVGVVVAGWVNLNHRIEEASNSPVTRIEYDMKFEFTGDEILELERRIEHLEERIQ